MNYYLFKIYIEYESSAKLLFKWEGTTKDKRIIKHAVNRYKNARKNLKEYMERI